MLNTRNEREGAPWEGRKEKGNPVWLPSKWTSSAKVQRLRYLENPKLDVFFQRIKGEKFATPFLQFGLLRGNCLRPSLEQLEKGKRVLKLSVSMSRSSSQPVSGLRASTEGMSGHLGSLEVNFQMSVLRP